jgi:nucleotide-binding universal stress UspA family protein
MMANPRTAHIRRILVALDSCGHDPAALESVVDLASRLEAELFGLFVEDINLLRSAALPFVRQVNLVTAADEQFDSSSTERQLRARASRAQRCLESAAKRKKVKWSFRTVRGRTSDEFASAAEEADLLVVERAVRPSRGEFHGGGPTRQAASRVPRSLLLLRREGLLGRPTLLAYDGGEEAERAAEVAARLSGEEYGPLEVLALAGSTDRQIELVQKLRQQLTPYGVEARFSSLFPSDLTALKALIRAVGGGLLVVGAGCPILKFKTPEELADFLDRPFLLIR